MLASRDEVSLPLMKTLKTLMDNRRQGAADDGERSLIGPSSGAAASTRDPHPPKQGFVYVLAFFSALGGFLFGYDTGVVSGAMLLLKKEMNLDKLWQELLVSSTVGAAAVSSLGGGFLNGRLGRKVCILVASFIFSIGGVILSAAPDKVVLLVGRITVGVGIGELVLRSTLLCVRVGHVDFVIFPFFILFNVYFTVSFNIQQIQYELFFRIRKTVLIIAGKLSQ